MIMLCALNYCGVKDITQSFESGQANRLLSADASKEWSLIAKTSDGEDVFSSCLESNSITFVNAVTDSLYVLGKTIACSESSGIDTLYKAKYELVVDGSNVFQEEITLTEEKYQAIRTMQVVTITSKLLEISYTTDGKTVEERYTF